MNMKDLKQGVILCLIAISLACSLQVASWMPGENSLTYSICSFFTWLMVVLPITGCTVASFIGNYLENKKKW